MYDTIYEMKEISSAMKEIVMQCKQSKPPIILQRKGLKETKNFLFHFHAQAGCQQCARGSAQLHIFIAPQFLFSLVQYISIHPDQENRKMSSKENYCVVKYGNKYIHKLLSQHTSIHLGFVCRPQYLKLVVVKRAPIKIPLKCPNLKPSIVK